MKAVTLGRLALIALGLLLALLPAATVAGAHRSNSVRLSVDAPEVFSFADATSRGVEALGLVQGVFHRAGFDTRLHSSAGGQAGPVALFDGRGEIRGTLRVKFASGGSYSGSVVVSGGAGRYSHATGTLKLAGTTDATAVPGVTVFPGRLRGSLQLKPTAPSARPRSPIHIDLRGKQTKLHFQATAGRRTPLS